MVSRQFLMALIFMMLSLKGFAQEAKFKALFMYNFTRYLEWPPEKQKGDFVIGIFGTSPITQELKIIAEKKKVGVQNIVIKELSSAAEMAECNILYVPENRSAKIEEIKANCSGKGTILITDNPSIPKNLFGINYVNIEGKQSFEINKKNIESQGVKINSTLLTLGKVVE